MAPTGKNKTRVDAKRKSGLEKEVSCLFPPSAKNNLLNETL